MDQQHPVAAAAAVSAAHPLHSTASTTATMDATMVLYDHEIVWAHQIKAAAQSCPHLQVVSDMEIAQWAIVTVPPDHGNHNNPPVQAQAQLQVILDRMYKLQCFRELYKIDTITPASPPAVVEHFLQDGQELLRAYVKDQQPGHLLSIDYMPHHGHYLIVWDRAAFLPARVATERDWRVYQGCTYMIFGILTSHLRAIREGLAVILECDGMSLHNYDSSFEERRVTELFGYYPFKNREFCFLHAPTVAMFLYQICKPFLSRDFHRAVKLDGKIEGLDATRIDCLYNMPTFEDAQDRLLERLQGYLKERVRHQLTYTLPPLPT